MEETDVVIIGAGLAGLSCALQLNREGLSTTVVERTDRVGGRVATDIVDGFLLDRGFQVLLSAYPAARKLLDYDSLHLQRFEAGALVRKSDKLYRITDPLRNPRRVFETLGSPIGSFADKLRILSLRTQLLNTQPEALLAKPEMSTQDCLRKRWKFSDKMIDNFFRPFFGGVSLDRSLQTTSRSFEYIMRMFVEGEAVVPEAGMQAIPQQLASALPSDAIRLSATVERIDVDNIVSILDSTERRSTIRAKAVVIATDGNDASSLSGLVEAPHWRPATCIYFAAEKSPIDEAFLVLNGDRHGIVNNLAVMSKVSASYAPDGAELISVTVLGNAGAGESGLVDATKEELSSWFGPEVSQWTHLRTYSIAHALPAEPLLALEPPERPVQIRNGLYVCGDHRDQASIQGALASGIRAAEAVATQF